MEKIKEIYNFIDEIAPFNTQAEWDNSGLLVGDKENNVNKILFALDITNDVVNYAHRIGAELIITHHPIIFNPVKEIKTNSVLYNLIKYNLNIICAHTNYDLAENGVNDVLCKTVQFESFYKVKDSFLNIGILKGQMDANQFASYLKEKLKGVVRYNNINKNIKKVAVCSGSGSDFLKDAFDLGCDALLTGDGSHHSFLDANEYGIGLFCAGHFETENPAMIPLMKKIKDKFNIECIIAEQKSPVITL